jgi:hypothetical protein
MNELINYTISAVQDGSETPFQTPFADIQKNRTYFEVEIGVKWLSFPRMWPEISIVMSDMI